MKQQSRSAQCGLTDAQYDRLRSLINQQCGLEVSENQKLRKLVWRRIRSLELSGPNDYLAYLEQNDDEVEMLVEEALTNKTYFFREPHHWSFIRDELLPEWRHRDTVKAWSAACSVGAEPYSFSMLAKRAGIDCAILATDLDRSALDQTRRARYSIDMIRRTPDEWGGLVHEMTVPTGDGNHRVITPSVQGSICIRRHNLNRSLCPVTNEAIDLIFLRNVMIYFGHNLKQQIVDNVTQKLAPGGHLLIGHTENLNRIDHDLQRVQPAVFRRPS